LALGVENPEWTGWTGLTGFTGFTGFTGLRAEETGSDRSYRINTIKSAFKSC
jgi:hypothetical protein